MSAVFFGPQPPPIDPDSDGDGVIDSEDYFFLDDYETFSRSELESFGFDSTSAIEAWDRIKFISYGGFPEAHPGMEPGEFYLIGDVEPDGWRVVGREGAQVDSDGNILKVYSPDRGVLWEKLSSEPSTPTTVDSDGDGVVDSEEYFILNPGFTYSKSDLESFSLIGNGIQMGDVIRGVADFQTEPIIPGEFYAVIGTTSLGFLCEDANGNSSYSTGQPYEIYHEDRGLYWEKVNLGSVAIQTPSTGPETAQLVELIALPSTGPETAQLVELIALPSTGPGTAQLVELIALPSTGPGTAQLVELVPSTGPETIQFVELVPLTGPNQIEVVESAPPTGPKESKVHNLPLNGPDSIEYTLLPSKGPEFITLQDSRSVPVEEISNKSSVPDKGKGYTFEGPTTGPKNIEPLPNSISINGYYPLYRDYRAANLASPIDSNHTHDFNGVTYYMPNGLDKIWHGDFEGPKKGPRKSKLVEVVRGRTKTPKYISHIYDSRTSALTGPFSYEGITAITSRDNSSEVYAVNSKHEVVKATLNDLKDSEFKFPSHRINVVDKFDIENEEGIVANEKGSFMYRGRYLATPFAEDYRIVGDVEEPLFFKDCYLAIAETNWMHLGSEAAIKELFRVDLTFAESSLGHVWLYATNESNKVSGQYKGEIRDNMKVFTNLRGKRFKLKLFIAAHKKYPWSMREMSLGYNQGKNF